MSGVPRRGRKAFPLLLGLLAAATLWPSADAAPPREAAAEISPAALQQIRELVAEKAARTPAQRKIDSQLLYAAKAAKGQRITASVQSLETDLPVSVDGGIEVEIRARVSERLRTQISKLGGVVIRSFEFAHSIRASMPLDSLEALAADEDVVAIMPPEQAMTQTASRRSDDDAPLAVAERDDVSRPTAAQAAFAQRMETVRRKLAEALPGVIPAAVTVGPLIGVSTSQGDVTHKANLVRNQLGVTGAGIKIGVLSDSFNYLGGYAADIASGDLPGPGNPYGYTTPVHLVGSGDGGTSDEGRAMLEIVHDLAPGAELFFATAFNSAADFANNIRLLRAAGCDIIIDDVFYFNESPVHSGQPASLVAPYNMAIITQAVNDVTASGALYFSSSGNSGNLNDGTSGAWEGDFVSAGVVAPFSTFPGGDVLDWDKGAAVATSNGVPSCGSGIRLHWADPMGTSTNDYDLFVLNSAGTSVLAASTGIQDGTAPQDPMEGISGCATNMRLLVLRKPAAAARFLSVTTLRGRLQYRTAGQARGHSAASLRGFGVAATPAANTFGAPTPNGPFPGVFAPGCCAVETFSTDGYRRVFFDEQNNPITPGNFLEFTNGGDIFLKPEITAADGVSTTLPQGAGLNPFYGTSAAAPHAGAIAALVKQAGPTLTPGQIRTILQSTALDIEAPGLDRDSGYGIVDALAAVTATGITPRAFLRQGTVAVTETAGNADGMVQPGETGSILVQLVNDGAVAATAISATLTTTTPGVTITSGTSAYPNLGSGGGAANNTTPFTFSVSPAAPCGLVINFKLTVTYTGGPSPLDVPFSYGSTAFSITTALDATAPPASPIYTAATGMQTGRVIRNGVAATCAADKAYPGPNDGTARRFDSYTFTTATGGGPYCVTVSLTHIASGAGKQMYVVAYRPTHVPATIGTNFVGDPGSSAANGTSLFSFNVPAAQQFTIVVHDVNTAFSSVGDSYTLTVTGACFGPPAPSIQAAGSALTADTCPAGGNTFAEPGEQVTVNFSLKNTGLLATTTLVATPVSPYVTSPAPATLPFGAIAPGATATLPLTFTLAPAAVQYCGATVPVTFALQDGATSLGTATFNVPVGGTSAVATFSQAFDTVTAPALPSGWATVTTSGVAWATTTTSPDTGPNAAFAPSDLALTSKTLVSPVISVPSEGGQLAFRNSYNLESGWDGGVLEISIAGGPFTDILAAGGAFLSGGYNATLSSSSNVLSGRKAWSGNSVVYVTTRVQLPVAARGTSVQVRWVLGLDGSVQIGPWSIDTVAFYPGVCGGPVVFVAESPSVPTICTGSSTQLAVAFRGTGPITMQWRRNSVNVVPDGVRVVQQDSVFPAVPAGVMSVLTINNASAADAGSYDVVATGACGPTATSAPPLVLDVQTSAYTASVTGTSQLCVGSSATATATTSAPSPQYFWSITGFTGGAEIVGSNTGSSITYRGTAPGRVVLEATVTPSLGGCKLTKTFEVTVVATPTTPVITAPSSVEAGATGQVASVASNVGSTYAWTITNGTITAGQGTASITFTAGTGGSLTLKVTETSSSCGSATAEKTIPVTGPGGPCVANGTTLCLNNQRFEVKVTWKTTDGTTGQGQAVPFAPAPPDSGYFWFFEAPNMELIIKVLDGRGVNGKFWVMFGALSDVEYTITIRDAQTGATKTYHNAQGTLASVADIEAFSDSGARASGTTTDAWAYLVSEKTDGRRVSFSELLSTETSSGAADSRMASLSAVEPFAACAADATTLCLNAGRFKVKVDWQVDYPIGTFGPGRSVPVTTDTGCFWFFNDRNIELAVKVLDGTGVNGKFWVFYGALSDVAYQLTVEDTTTGASKVYSNQKGTLASVADIEAFTP